jgi:hypothetical protein
VDSVQENLEKQAQIPRPAPVARSGSLAPPAAPTGPPRSLSGSMVPQTTLSSSLRPNKDGVSDDLTQMVFLRVHIPKTANRNSHDVDVTTTLPIQPGTYMADVLKLACKKQNLGDSKDWVFLVKDGGKDIIVPSDRTVESLGEALNVTLVQKKSVPAAVHSRVGALQNVNPSASIFKRLSEPPQPKYVSTADLTTTYKKFTVHRKMPMPLGRHERVLSIDGDYIHIMPSESKAMFDGGRMASFHVRFVSECRQSKRSPSTFRLVVIRDKESKKYEFEAESPEASQEIVNFINRQMIAFKKAEQSASVVPSGISSFRS